MNDSNLTESDLQRIAVAVSCRDCDRLPRVADAGSVVGTGPDAIQFMHNGLKTYCETHYGKYNVEVIRQLKGVHEPQEECVFHDAVKRTPRDGTMVELGSFWGYYSLWFLRDNPDRRAILVEPVPSGLEAGRRNFALNECEGTFIHAAIADAPAPAADIELWPGFSTHAPVVTVDEIRDSCGLDNIAILHADIQGHELKMLEGAKKTLSARAATWIFISTHSENIHQAILKVLRHSGYRIIAEHTPAESFSVDGLAVATIDPSARPISITKRTSAGSIKAKLKARLRVNILEPVGLRPPTA